jgi:SAM-dependent methyltransferase
MRKVFAKKLTSRKELLTNIELIDGSAAAFDSRRTFPAAFLSGSFDHFLDDRERLASLKNIHKHLKPDGILVFDVFLELMKETTLSLAGKAMIGNAEYRRFVGGEIIGNGKKKTNLVFEKYIDGKFAERIIEHSLVGIIDHNKLYHLLNKSGFKVSKEFSDYDFTSFKKGDSLLIVEAIKIKT